jgi:hypothetical protein
LFGYGERIRARAKDVRRAGRCRSPRLRQSPRLRVTLLRGDARCSPSGPARRILEATSEDPRDPQRPAWSSAFRRWAPAHDSVPTPRPTSHGSSRPTSAATHDAQIPRRP